MMSRLKSATGFFYDNSFNVKFAIISASVNGLIAAGVNHAHGLQEMVEAGGTQGLASFFMTGITSRIVQHFSPIDNKFISYSFGSLVPASLTFGMSYVAHKLNSTPEVIESLVAPTLISFITSFGTNYITRKGY